MDMYKFVCTFCLSMFVRWIQGLSTFQRRNDFPKTEPPRLWSGASWPIWSPWKSSWNHGVQNWHHHWHPWIHKWIINLVLVDHFFPSGRGPKKKVQRNAGRKRRVGCFAAPSTENGDGLEPISFRRLGASNQKAARSLPFIKLDLTWMTLPNAGNVTSHNMRRNGNPEDMTDWYRKQT